MGDGEKPTGSGGKSTEVPAEPSTGSPRLIPVPNSSTNCAHPDPPPDSEDSGNTSGSFNRRCAPSQAPEYEGANYDRRCYSQMRDLCKRRGRHKKKAKAALETRLEAMDSVARQPLTSNENDMDTSSSVLRKRGRSMAQSSNIGNSTMGVEGKRSLGDAPATAMAAEMAVVQAHAQWSSPAL